MSHAVTDADYLIGNESPFQNKLLDLVMRPDAHVFGAVFIAMDMSFRCDLFVRTCEGVGRLIGWEVN
jgi:hypothetical protein